MRPTLLLKSGTLYWVIRTYDPADGTTLMDADSVPAVAVRKNGAAVGDSVAVTKRTAATGIYDCSYNPASEIEGDQFTFEEASTVDGTATSWNWSVMVVDSDLTGKVLGGGSGTISGVGARVEGFAGNGARSVIITVETSGGAAIHGAKVRVTKLTENFVQETNGSGQVTFNLDDGSWAVSITKHGYSYAGTTLVVDGDESATYTMTTNSVSPPAAPNLTVGTLLCLGTDGLPETGVDITFRLTVGPGNAGYALDAAEFTETSDADGEIEVSFIRTAQYTARRGTVGREVAFTAPSSASFTLPEALGAP